MVLHLNVLKISWSPMYLGVPWYIGSFLDPSIESRKLKKNEAKIKLAQIRT